MTQSEKDIKELKQLRKQLVELMGTLNMMRYGINSTMQQVDKALGVTDVKEAPVSSTPEKVRHKMLVQKYL